MYKANIRGFTILEIFIPLALIAVLCSVPLYAVNLYQTQEQAAYESGKTAALKIAGDLAPVVIAMYECHKLLGPQGIREVLVGPYDYCPDLLSSLRDSATTGKTDKVGEKVVEVGVAYAVGFWRGASPAVYAAANGGSSWDSLRMVIADAR